MKIKFYYIYFFFFFKSKFKIKNIKFKKNLYIKTNFAQNFYQILEWVENQIYY